MITPPRNVRFSCGKEAIFSRYGTKIVKSKDSKGKIKERVVEDSDALVYTYTLDGQERAPSMIGKEVSVTLKYLNSLLSVNLLSVLK